MAVKAQLAVIGGGISGLLSALLCARSGVSVLLFAPEVRFPTPTDSRTTALMMPAVRMFQKIGLWERVCGISAPLERLRLIDKTSTAGDKPDVTFSATELDEDAFGWNFPLKGLDEALRAEISRENNIQFISDFVTAAKPSPLGWSLETEKQSFQVSLVMAADGGRSLLRQSAGIDVKKWSYKQTALIAAFDHEEDHEMTSSEFHYDCGPTVVVPLPNGKRSSLVHVVKPDQAKLLEQYSEAQAADYLYEITAGLLGRISPFKFSGSFPLSGMVADRFASNRVLLIGEAAHQIPPIGAQGLNMGVRDAALAAEIIIDAARLGQDIGCEDVLKLYQRQRKIDVLSRMAAVDLLSKSLTTNIGPLLVARRKGLDFLNKTPFLRKYLMQAGMKPFLYLPKIMQEEI